MHGYCSVSSAFRFVCVSPTIITPLATSICSMWTIQCSTVDASIVCCRPSGWMVFLIQQGGSPYAALPTPHRGFPEVTRGLRLVPPGRLERPHPAPEAGALSAELWGPEHRPPEPGAGVRVALGAPNEDP